MGAALLRLMGPVHLKSIVAILDECAFPMATSADRTGPLIAEQVEARLGVRIPTPITDPTGEARVATLLWATHGAFPPGHAGWVILRVLARATEAEATAVLGRGEHSSGWIIDRVARRAQSFRLMPGPITGLDLAARTRRAAEAVRWLRDRLDRANAGWPLAVQDELHHCLHLTLTHRRISALPEAAALRRTYLASPAPDPRRRLA